MHALEGLACFPEGQGHELVSVSLILQRSFVFYFKIMYSSGEPTILEEMAGWMDWSGPQAPGGTSGWKNSLDFKFQRKLAWGLMRFVPNRNQAGLESCTWASRGRWRQLAVPGVFEEEWWEVGRREPRSPGRGAVAENLVCVGRVGGMVPSNPRQIQLFPWVRGPLVGRAGFRVISWPWFPSW